MSEPVPMPKEYTLITLAGAEGGICCAESREEVKELIAEARKVYAPLVDVTTPLTEAVVSLNPDRIVMVYEVREAEATPVRAADVDAGFIALRQAQRESARKDA